MAGSLSAVTVAVAMLRTTLLHLRVTVMVMEEMSPMMLCMNIVLTKTIRPIDPIYLASYVIALATVRTTVQLQTGVMPLVMRLYVAL